MMWHTAAEWHAAFNDLPPALFLASLLFDLAGTATKRPSLRDAGFWALLLGVAGAAAAITTGLLAEGSIEHGEAVHRVMERHETMAISVSALFAILAGWRVWRRGSFRPQEWGPYLVAAGVGAAGIIFVASLGGTIVYRHGGGIPSEVMRAGLEEREAGHEHAPGQEHRHDEPAGENHEHDAPPPVKAMTGVDSARGAVQTGDSARGHTHPPGTPPHRH